MRLHRSRLERIVCGEFRLSDQDADDVLQDVLVRARSRLWQLRDPAALGAWLNRLTRHACVDLVRRRHVTEQLSEQLADSGAGAQVDAVVSRLTLVGALDELSVGSREVIERFFLLDESYDTIARELDIAPGTIASRIARGLARLRVELAAEAA